MNRTVLFHLENAQALLNRATDIELDEIRIHLDSAITQLKQKAETK